jgi:hypothetical protein
MPLLILISAFNSCSCHSFAQAAVFQNFSCFGSGGSHASLRNVLFSATGSLYHWVNGPVGFPVKAIDKLYGAVVDDFGLLAADQMAVAAVHGNETRLMAVCFWHIAFLFWGL